MIDSEEWVEYTDEKWYLFVDNKLVKKINSTFIKGIIIILTIMENADRFV